MDDPLCSWKVPAPGVQSDAGTGKVDAPEGPGASGAWEW
jgi:hypothetical protein